jgi:hypothetical protein
MVESHNIPGQLIKQGVEIFQLKPISWNKVPCGQFIKEISV